MESSEPLMEWWVSVEGAGFIGNVWAPDQKQAHVAALAKYGKKGKRAHGLRRPEMMFIFEGDSFDVSL